MVASCHSVYIKASTTVGGGSMEEVEEKSIMFVHVESTARFCCSTSIVCDDDGEIGSVCVAKSCLCAVGGGGGVLVKRMKLISIFPNVSSGLWPMFS